MSQARTDIDGNTAHDAANAQKLSPAKQDKVAHPARTAMTKDASARGKPARPTQSQLNWLACGIDQAGGKLPLFDSSGRKVSERTVVSCIEKGWAEPWFNNPLKPDWQVCRLTNAGRALVESGT